MQLKIDDKYDKIFILTDKNTKKHCLPLLKLNKKYKLITIPNGEDNKSLYVTIRIWKTFEKYSATKNSLLINLGGGVITDLGGFCASTFKRGIDFINIPTTLLGMVDAAHGGKNGINFNGLKNEIGSIKNADKVIVHYPFLKTLSYKQMNSAYFEIIKYALIADSVFFNDIKTKGFLDIERCINTCIQIKKEISTIDPNDKSVRKILNFGHTIGHALEAYSLKHDRIPLTHGEAVGLGMACESYLSFKKNGLLKEELDIISCLISSRLLNFDRKIPSIKKLLPYLKSDKKNSKGNINFCLLSTIGKCNYDINISDEKLLNESLEFCKNTIKQATDFAKT